MFLTMFGASALATILFAPKNTQNYSSQFNSLNEGINKLDGKLDSLLDVSTFMKARSCLTEFSPRLIGMPTLSYTHHSIDDIMLAAKEGFHDLLEIAKADDNNFITARAIFEKTYGNADWVSAQFANQLDAYAQLDTLINNYSVKLLSLVKAEDRYEHTFRELERTYKRYNNLWWFQFKKRRAVQKTLLEIQRELIAISNEFVATAQLDLNDNELFILFMIVRSNDKDYWASRYFEYATGKRNSEFDYWDWTSEWIKFIPCSCSQHDYKYGIGDHIYRLHYRDWFADIEIKKSHRKLFNILLSGKTISRKHLRA